MLILVLGAFGSHPKAFELILGYWLKFGESGLRCGTHIPQNDSGLNFFGAFEFKMLQIIG